MKHAVCFICLTTYQYMVADIIAKKIYEKEKKKSLLVLKYFQIPELRNSCYAEYLCIPKNISGKLYYFFFIKTPFYRLFKMSRFLSGFGATLAFFNDRDPITMKCAGITRKYRNQILLIEEGIGTYFGLWPLKPIGEEIIPDRALVGFPEIYRQTHRDETRVIKLKYVDFFNEEYLKSYMKKIPRKIQADILLLGQGVPGNEFARECEIDLIGRIRNDFPDIKVMIKPHPRDESPDRYLESNSHAGISVLKGELAACPVESLIFSMDVKFIFSLDSSGGITLANMFNSLTVLFGLRLYPLQEQTQVEEKLKFQEYMDNIFFPRDFMEVKEIIQSKK